LDDWAYVYYDGKLISSDNDSWEEALMKAAGISYAHVYTEDYEESDFDAPKNYDELPEWVRAAFENTEWENEDG